MTSTIQSTITDVLPAGTGHSYQRYVDAAVAALIAREQDLSALCVAYAVDLGANGETVRQFLSSIGMATVEPEPEQRPEESRYDALLTRIQELAAEIESLRSHR